MQSAITDFRLAMCAEQVRRLDGVSPNEARRPPLQSASPLEPPCPAPFCFRRQPSSLTKLPGTACRHCRAGRCRLDPVRHGATNDAVKRLAGHGRVADGYGLITIRGGGVIAVRDVAPIRRRWRLLLQMIRPASVA